MNRKMLAVAMLVLIMAPAVAQAQASANISASATVATALTATKQADLAFGTVYPTFLRTVATGAVGAARVLFAGSAGAEVNVTFTTLPATLTGPGAPISISYSAAHALTAAGVQTTFTPASGATTLLSGIGELFVFLGGAITPAAGQVAGAYGTTVVVQAAYTGN